MSYAFRTSRYTFEIPAEDGALLYNANTGAVLKVTGRNAHTIATQVSGRPRTVRVQNLPEQTVTDLLECGMLVPMDLDELNQIRERFRQARADSPIVITITTTMDCNLGCYYCYEQRSSATLAAHDIDSIVRLADDRLRESGKQALHVDWYGGEPLLNVEFLEAASRALQELCARTGVYYSASVISNGTCWPADVERFVTSNRIGQVQISFDGLEGAHNKRRRYRKGRAPFEKASSFNQAVELVDKLLDHVRVDVRFNMDRGNAGDLPGFLSMMQERGWFNRRFPAVVQPARLSAYSERSSFMQRTQLSADAYEDLRAEVRRTVGSFASVEESEAPDGFPFPRTSVCAALANDSVVVGADGELYRCGLQVGESGRSVGDLAPTNSRQLPLLNVSSDSGWWKEFDPTLQPKCARCSFLPICWSGCPKKHLEGDTHAIDEQGTYWRRNLSRLVTNGLGTESTVNYEFSLEDQFRGELVAS